MKPPYPIPVKQKTTRRCQYHLPGKRYNCRAVGHYVMEANGKRYCGPHYDAKWKFLNPEFGQQHDWHIHVNKFTGAPDRYPTCRRCGDIKVYDGIVQLPCRGVMPIIELR